ncbi:MAG: inosine/guanosine kinase [Myxococcota bacterium]|nr:inosine/guanosine kinase [Myxococcota bacterium]
MRFPGPRVAKYYFPVTEKKTAVTPPAERLDGGAWYVVGLDEVIVDLEVQGVPPELLPELGLVLGESVQLSPLAMKGLLEEILRRGLRWRYAAGGTVANTLCNYTHLSGEPALLLGAIESCIRPGSAAFAYVAQTPKAVSLEHLLARDGQVGIAVTCFTPDGERSFGVAPGISGDYPAEAVPAHVVQGAALVLTSLYCLADPQRPIAGAAMRLMQLAHEAGVPVAFGLGTASLVRRMREELIAVLKSYVTIAAMNAREAEALTDEVDPLLAAQRLLEWVDVVVLTEGARGLTLAGHTDESVKRATRESVRSKTIPEYNRWEFSRLVRRRDCLQPLPIYSHIHPYLGGPEVLSNTSGAGDAALAALLHDIAANRYHRESVPDSKKHSAAIPFLSYSSLSRSAQYGNRVAYEVLRSCSPRLEGPVGQDQEELFNEPPPPE